VSRSDRNDLANDISVAAIFYFISSLSVSFLVLLVKVDGLLERLVTDCKMKKKGRNFQLNAQYFEGRKMVAP